MSSLAETAGILANTFLGSDLAFGRSVPTGNTASNGKAETKSWTEKKPITLNDWMEHVAGRSGVGIIPINAMNNVSFGAIDVDQYGIDPVEINQLALSLHLPMVLCLSKSGGIHLFLFCNEWVPAQLMIERLDGIAALLGFGTCEIFPKQSSIRVEQDKEDFGNWINMPYFGGSNRVALNLSGIPIKDVKEFAEFVDSRRISKAQLEAINPTKWSNNILPDGPPCLNLLWSDSKHQGHRNTLLANTAVYLKKAHPDCWGQKLDEFNRQLEQPLPRAEIEAIHKSYSGKDYKYQCHDPLLRRFCNASECKKRRFGIAEGNEGDLLALINMRSLSKRLSEPLIYFLDIKNETGMFTRLTLTHDELINYPQFWKAVHASMNIVLPRIKQGVWDKILTELSRHVTEIEVPADATPLGQLELLLQDFVQRNETETFDCILRDRVYSDEEGFHFRLRTLEEYLERKKFKEIPIPRVRLLLKDHFNGQPGKRRLAGVEVRYWSLPPDFLPSAVEPLAVTTTQSPF